MAALIKSFIIGSVLVSTTCFILSEEFLVPVDEKSLQQSQEETYQNKTRSWQTRGGEEVNGVPRTEANVEQSLINSDESLAENLGRQIEIQKEILSEHEASLEQILRAIEMGAYYSEGDLGRRKERVQRARLALTVLEKGRSAALAESRANRSLVSRRSIK